MDALTAKTFDTSGKSPAPLYRRAICKTAHGAAHRVLGAMTGQTKSPQLKLHRLATANDRLRVAARPCHNEDVAVQAFIGRYEAKLQQAGFQEAAALVTRSTMPAPQFVRGQGRSVGSFREATTTSRGSVLMKHQPVETGRIYNTIVNVGGIRVAVAGRWVDGILRIGSAFIPP